MVSNDDKIMTIFLIVKLTQHPYMFALGMSELVKERPANPIEYLANYLVRHDPQRVGSTNSAMTQELQAQNMMMNMKK